MPRLSSTARDTLVMGGKPCIRDTRITVSLILGLLAAGRAAEEIVREYAALTATDIEEALTYAAWRASGIKVDLDEPLPLPLMPRLPPADPLRRSS